ncbi:MAG: hypothetical protein GX558_10685 [Clostridiales bacterium]|nr:hypothetical protein [Clostridiales bacterium]
MEQVPPRTANADETDAILRASLNPSCCILNRYAQDAPPKNGHAFITTFTLDGDAGIYDLTFVFDRLVVTWDAYDGKAWYEDEKWKKRREN